MNSLYSTQFLANLATKHILMIGVGGIGCEVLKIVCKLSFSSFHIVDLDTIETSNLNRQFLFRKHHRGQPKAHVAKETVNKINPALNIQSHFISVYDLELSFFKQFDFIILALDNQEARSFVNKVSLSLNIPLVDAGSLGYNGQAYMIQRGTKCYDCFPLASTQQQYPACTIRSLPQKPEHCIIWAKYLFSLFFGPPDEDNLLKDLKKEGQTGDELQIAKNHFQAIFKEEIEKQVASDSSKFQNIVPISVEDFQIQTEGDWKKGDLQSLSLIYKIEEYVSMFIYSFQQLYSQKQQVQALEFNKDDVIQIKFLTSCANLRSHIFGLKLENERRIKEVAGNIVPAIASTNSIVAALEVQEMLEYFLQKFEGKEVTQIKTMYVQNNNSKKITSYKIENANPNCPSCQINPLFVESDLKTKTLQELVEIVKKEHPDLDISISQGSSEIFNSFNEDQEKQLAKQLNQILNKKINRLIVSDEDSGAIIDTVIVVNFEQEEKVYRIGEKQDKKLKIAQPQQEEKTTTTKRIDKSAKEYLLDDDDVIKSDSEIKID